MIVWLQVKVHGRGLSLRQNSATAAASCGTIKCYMPLPHTQ